MSIAAQNSESTETEVVGHVLRPASSAPAAFAPTAPPGFRVDVFAKDLGKPRMIAVADDGTIYVTRRDSGDVVMLRDADGNGQADGPKVVAMLKDVHGIALHDGAVYLATVKDVLTAPVQPDGTFGPMETIVDDLPDGGQHPNRTLAVGPDGWLYVSIGSTCNDCRETTPYHATIVRMKLDGSAREVFASGLRNTIGFAWQPGSGRLYGMDHGIDWLGDNQQPEELNEIRQGQQYGWPYVFGNGMINAHLEPPKPMTPEEWRAKSTAPVLAYTPHSAPMQMVFYHGTQFPEDARDDAFVAMRGSWNRKPPSGYEVVRVKFEGGKPTAVEPFLKGFLKPSGAGFEQLGRPAGLAIARDGSLLVGDEENGIIYRVSYSAARGTSGQR